MDPPPAALTMSLTKIHAGDEAKARVFSNFTSAFCPHAAKDPITNMLITRESATHQPKNSLLKFTRYAAHGKEALMMCKALKLALFGSSSSM
jgi:hypothetical protein